jgi:RNA polymerase sigma-70 factor (ECF subfamily)
LEEMPAFFIFDRCIKMRSLRRPDADPLRDKSPISLLVFLNTMSYTLDMSDARPKDVTQLLIEWNRGKQGALDELLPLVYDELHRVAARCMRREQRSHTLQATALVHEAYLRLIDQTRVQWQNRAHFLGVAAQMIRRILVDYARAKQAAKRGGKAMRLLLDDAVGMPTRREVDIVRLDDALHDLGRIDPQQARIVELRFFTGLSIEETAEALSISPATVKRDWVVARAWLFRELSRRADAGL